MKQQTDRHRTIQVNVRAKDRDTLARWKAAAAASDISLNKWLCKLANDASLPIRKKKEKGA